MEPVNTVNSASAPSSHLWIMNLAQISLLVHCKPSRVGRKCPSAHRVMGFSSSCPCRGMGTALRAGDWTPGGKSEEENLLQPQ